MFEPVAQADFLKPEATSPKVRAKFAGCRIYRAAAGSHTSTGNYQAFAFDAETHDDNHMFVAAVDSNRLVVPIGLGGYWNFGLVLTFVNNATGARQVRIVDDAGTRRVNYSIDADNNSDTTCPVQTGPIFMRPQQYVELDSYQNSGGTLDFRVGEDLCYAWATYLGT